MRFAKGVLFLLALFLGMSLALSSPASAAPSCDRDGDGFLKDNRKCGGNDCNDRDASINPGAPEVCDDGVDNNCDGQIDEGCTTPPICGDNVVNQPSEQCDGTDDAACPGLCQVDCTCGTPPPVCGDNVVNQPGEECDGTDDTACPGLCQVDCTCGPGSGQLPGNLAAAGDSITQAFAASCSCNTNFFCLLCLLGGDQPQHSWFDGWSSNVVSVHDRYLGLDGSIGADKSAAADGSEMRGSSNSFSVQADKILAQTPVADHVEVELGGNDLCNRDCINPANCADPVYTDAQWTAAVRAGLDKLVAGLPDGSTIYLLGVPRVQDLRQAGLDKQAGAGNIDCEGAWADFSICVVGTQGAALNGESISTRLAGISERQQRYNEILRDEAAAYNANSSGQNPRGIEVVADYVDEATPSVGTFHFGAGDIDGGDCFHPSILGQNTAADLAWTNNPDR
jgi:hypothetical protein